MAHFVWKTSSTQFGDGQLIISGRLPTAAAANAFRQNLVDQNALTLERSGTTEVTAENLNGLGIGAYLKDAPALADRELVISHVLTFDAAAQWQKAQFARLPVAWNGWIARRQSWWSELSGAGSAPLIGTTRWCHHQLGAAAQAIRAAGPFAPMSQADREGIIDYLVEWVQDKSAIWYHVLDDSVQNRNLWQSAGLSPVNTIYSDLIQLGATGGGEGTVLRRDADTAFNQITGLELGEDVWTR